MEQLVSSSPIPRLRMQCQQPAWGQRHSASTQQILIEHPYYVPGTERGSDMAPELPLKMSKASSRAQSNPILIKPSDIGAVIPT